MSPNDEQEGKQGRVQVHYFPKRKKVSPAAGRTRTLTLPEQRLVPSAPEDELVTEPHFVLPSGIDEHRPTRRTTPLSTRKSKGRRKTTGEKRIKPDAMRLDELAHYGHELFKSDRLDEARLVFEQLVNAGVADAFPYTMLGTVYLAKGDQGRALALFEAALQIDPFDLAALVYRGEIRLYRRRVKAALEDLQRAIEIGAGDDPFVERARNLVAKAATYSRRSPKK